MNLIWAHFSKPTSFFQTFLRWKNEPLICVFLLYLWGFFQWIASTDVVWNNYTDILKQDPACLKLSSPSFFNAWFKVVSVLPKLLPLRAKTYQTYGQTMSSKGNERLFEKMDRRACPRVWSRGFCLRSSRASMFVQSCWIIYAYSQTRSMQASKRIFEEMENRGSAPAFELRLRPFGSHFSKPT